MKRKWGVDTNMGLGYGHQAKNNSVENTLASQVKWSHFILGGRINICIAG